MLAAARRFGAFTWDLAATAENRKCEKFISPEQNSLSIDWRTLDGSLWLNPPFERIRPWAEKCAATRQWNKIFLLTPASVGSNWFRDFVFKKALVLALNGRITFVGETMAYPKDCMLSCFGFEPGFDVWTWPL